MVACIISARHAVTCIEYQACWVYGRAVLLQRMSAQYGDGSSRVILFPSCSKGRTTAVASSQQGSPQQYVMQAQN